MAGRLVVTTLNNDTGVLATQNGMTGIAKAWVNFDGVPSTPTIASSFNVSSVVKNSTGDYTINFTTAMPNANYVINANAALDGQGFTGQQNAQPKADATPTTTSCVVLGSNTISAAPQNPTRFYVVILSS
jgi:hypothetical protein